MKYNTEVECSNRYGEECLRMGCFAEFLQFKESYIFKLRYYFNMKLSQNSTRIFTEFYDCSNSVKQFILRQYETYVPREYFVLDFVPMIYDFNKTSCDLQRKIYKCWLLSTKPKIFLSNLSEKTKELYQGCTDCGPRTEQEAVDKKLNI